MTTIEAPPRTYATRGGVALASSAPLRRVAPPTPEVERRHLRVVPPVRRIRARVTPATGVVLTGVLFAMLFAIAIAHTVLVQGQIRLDSLGSQLTVEQAKYQELRTQVATLESPSRVVAAAQGLGMVAPDDLVYLQPAAADPTPPPGKPSDDTADRTPWSVMKPLLESPAP